MRRPVPVVPVPVVPVPVVPVPVMPAIPVPGVYAAAFAIPHAAWSRRSWSLARSSTFWAWSSWRSALSIAVWSAACTASAWSSVRWRILRAWSSVSCDPDTTGELVILSSRACWARSCDCAWASSCCAEKGSIDASTWPAVTWSPTLTSTAVSWPPLAKPRFCSVTAVSDPVADTPLVTEVRCTT